MATLSGCFPYAMNYVYLDTPGVTHKRAPCYDGAPMGAVYERGGVSFELALQPHTLSRSKEAYLKLRAPRHVAISIPEPVARVRFRGAPENLSASVNLILAAPDWQGPYVEEMRRKSPLAEYRFVFLNFPTIDSPGTLQLPVVLVDGSAVESPLVTFEPRTYAGMVPLNC